MTFQFYCPQGHLLQGDAAHMGMTCQCPHCGTTFIIPTVTLQDAETVAAEPTAVDPFGAEPGEAAAEDDFLANLGRRPSSDSAPSFDDFTAATPGHGRRPSIELETEQASPRVLHIPCPNGHELETPLDMLGQEALCPHCGAQFRLRSEDSVEAQRQREKRDRQRGQVWFYWAITTAVIVTIGLVALIVLSAR